MSERRIMQRWITRGALFPTLLALAIAALGSTGCAKKLTTVDAALIAGVFPEGVRDSLDRTPSHLVMWQDTGLPVSSNADPNILFYTLYRGQAGGYVGQVMDYTGSSAYQLFRRESGGGFSPFQDFAFTPARRWSDHEYYGGATGTLVLQPAQLYEFVDPNPAAIPDPGYIGRAVIAGLSGSSYPLTNLGQAPAGAPVDSMQYLGSPTPPDSLINMQWSAVPGAAGYWIHIYQKRQDIRDGRDAVITALVSPIASGKVRDFFIGFIPAPATSFKLGDPVPAGGRILVYRILNGLQEVFIRVSAVDADGRMLATIMGPSSDTDASHQVVGAADVQIRYPINGRKVTPNRPPPPELPTP